MACRKLPYYHRFLYRENFSSSLKVVYRKQLKEEKGYTGKYQWDLIHNPKAELFSWLEDEEEGEGIFGGKLVLLDEKHTMLLNHVYDYNHDGKLIYKDKIEKSRQEIPTEKSLDLDYAGSKEKEWINTWKLRTSTSDEILAKIIKKIQNAEKGKKIEKMSLNEKGIYIGKYKLDNVEYPIAVYSEKADISNLVKVQVSDINDLDKDENKKHIKSEETFIKYMIIAFYEEGTSNPVLVMQIEKFDISKMQNTKEKWLTFLNILEQNNETENIENIFTDEKLKELYPKVDEKVIKDIFSYISEFKDEYGVDDCKKLIHFITQADHESGGFRYMKEIGSFSGEREKYKGRGIFQLTWEGNYKNFQDHLKTMNIEVDLIAHPELLEETKYAVLSALWYWQKNNLSDYTVDLKVSTALKISKLVNCGNLNYCGCEKDDDGKCKKDENGKTIKCSDCAPNGWEDRQVKFEKYKNQIPCE